MFRYLAFYSSERSDRAAALVQRALQQSTPWAIGFENDRLTVLYADTSAYGAPILLENQRGIILGPLFRGSSIAHLSASDANAIADSRGQFLVERFWGDYVAFLIDPKRNALDVVRGPAATLPCLHIQHEGIHLYFSWTESVARLGVGRYTLDWTHVARAMLGPVSSRNTSIQQITEILPGERETVDAQSRSNSVLWDLARISESNQHQDPPTAADELRTVTRSCLHAWAALFPGILVGLSGGLDSSITLACLADAPSSPSLVGLTQYAPNSDSDERFYARLISQKTATPLIEYARSPAVGLRSAIHQVRPETNLGLKIPEVDRIEPDAALAHGATAIFRGNGGDELACRTQAGLYVADYLQTRGIGRELLPLATHAATMDGGTVWGVLYRGLYARFSKRPWNQASVLAEDLASATLLRADLLESLTTVMATAIEPPRSDLPPGRMWQIGLITARRPFYGPFTQPGDPAQISPLLSQPIIELALTIPTWFQIQNRRDRALMRMAFARDLPKEIAYRSDKGFAETLANETVHRNLPFVREMLPGGLVVQQEIVDIPKLEAALSDTPSASSVSSVALFDLLGAEIWARAWRS